MRKAQEERLTSSQKKERRTRGIRDGSGSKRQSILTGSVDIQNAQQNDNEKEQFANNQENKVGVGSPNRTGHDQYSNRNDPENIGSHRSDRKN